MTRSQTRWIIRVIDTLALIDILGFRSLINTTPLAEVVKKVEVLLADIQNRPSARAYSSDGQERVRTLGEMQFSDTVLLWTPLIKDQEAGKIAGGHLFFAVAELIYKSFMTGLPLRAGTGFGQCFIDPDRHIFVGSAIADAYETETSQDWIGGALHPSVPWGDQCYSEVLKDYFKGKSLCEITPLLVEKFKRERIKTPTKYGRVRAEASVNREFEMLSRVFNLAIDFTKAESNPCSRVRKFKLDNERYRYFLPEEEPLLLSVMEGKRAHLRPLVIVALGLGLRKREQLNLRRGQVDFSRNVVIATRTKGKKNREIPLDVLSGSARDSEKGLSWKRR